MSIGLAFAAALSTILGSILGLIHFGTLAMVTDRLVEGRMVAAAGLQAVRLVLLVVILVLAARFGALPLLTCLAGILAGRRLVLRRAKPEP